MRKTFRIGEEAVGGVIQVFSRPRNVFEVRVFDWNTLEQITWRFVYNYDELRDYLEEISTVYWADKIINYFKNKEYVSETNQEN